MEQSESFGEWCVVELMGYTRLAGFVSDQAIGGDTFIRIDVPEVDGKPEFTKLYGKRAIYAITPTTEEVVRKAVSALRPTPVTRYEMTEQPALVHAGGDLTREPCDDDIPAEF